LIYLLIDYDSLEETLLLLNRKLVVTSNELDLSRQESATVFVLMVDESFGSAGGRAGGSGSRKISRIFGYTIKQSIAKQFVDVTDAEIIDLFEVPYSAVALDIKLSKGEELVVQGIVDPILIESYMRIVNTIG
jgi:hypothetical protein